MTRVYVRHVREAGFCLTGLRIWANHRGFSVKEFLRDGMDADRLRTLDDAMVDKAIALAEKEENGQ